jgi:hypothetical protein
MSSTGTAITKVSASVKSHKSLELSKYLMLLTILQDSVSQCHYGGLWEQYYTVNRCY